MNFFRSWSGINLFLCLLLSIPLFTIFISIVPPKIEIWSYLFETRLIELLINTFYLTIGVGVGSFLLGTSLAWIVVMYEFPLKKVFDWALILPMAVPAYVIGFVILTAFEYGGIVPGALEYLFGIEGFYPDIRSGLGVIIVMSLVLYPYVYLLARSAFRDQNQSYLDAARSLGVTQKMLFIRVALPLARPSIVAGVSLALMESLADFGTVAIFSFDTFTTAIYEVWFGMYERSAATQLASMLLMFNFIFFWLEYRTRGKAVYYQSSGASRKQKSFRVSLPKKIILFSYPAIILCCSFVFPVAVLIYWALDVWDMQVQSRFFEYAFNSLLLGLLSGLIIIPIALILAYGKRLNPGIISFLTTRISTLGYAIPGSVIAVGVLIPLSWIDYRINDITSYLWDYSPGLILTGSIAAILFAYTVRFMTVGFNSVDSSLLKITTSMDMAAQSLGLSRLGIMKKIHFKLIRSGLLTGFILVFVDVMKEMPATLLMRPFGFDTLATWIWQLTSEAMAKQAALPALIIVAVGLFPVIILIGLDKKTSFGED
ncbi:MAG: iron ABC transporter permease [Deltaproteobacteria bacterium]|nr:iron ABC transporter permease [Deltaproteobacteria bacterium]